jgi:hypothetical protein
MAELNNYSSHSTQPQKMSCRVCIEKSPGALQTPGDFNDTQVTDQQMSIVA